MKLKAAIVSFLCLAAYGVLARATDDFTLPASSDNAEFHAVADDEGLLIPRLEEYTGRASDTSWRGKSPAPFKSYRGKPAFRSGSRSDETSSRTASDSSVSGADEHRPWVGVWIAVGGLIGAIATVTLGQWRRSKGRRPARAPLSSVLVATLADSQPRIVKPRKLAEQPPKETRRAA
ncbi:MAG: hypothetical protein JW959_07690 [Pirellulales bacterium]|nr:hypothetical protein [Pirellulales bacterium]